ncbi:MAG: phosphate ABC transporter permease PstA [Rhodospirillales bacterium]|nr:phosphate ABC transporter permease PstA [Rhodospirillales bacterium]MBO6788404.1 phosphate ABC transporter permease PstA [Rhodospirillales bacterium]
MTDAVMTEMQSSNQTRRERAANASEAVRRGLKKRYAAEARFRAYGIGAVGIALACIVVLFTTIISSGLPAFTETTITLNVELKQEDIDPEGTRDASTLINANYRKLVFDTLRAEFPDVTKRRDKRALTAILSSGAAYQVQQAVVEDPSLIGQTVTFELPVSADFDLYEKGVINKKTAEADRRVSDQQMAWFDTLEERGLIETGFNTTFFTHADSREPELAGILGATMGSLFTMLVTLALSFPIGVCAAVYLEEFAPKNRLTQIIEVNINNLAAVPSIVFGLLGLAVFINFFGLPRSAPLVGGMVLALMTLPTIIIASRAALKAVPPSIREAALGLGASRMQVVTHHVLPLAMPGILTGTIIGMAQALGETAPLLMIGMVAFIVDIPGGITDPATVLPVQVYLWADSPERAFVARTSAAIMILLTFLIFMNALAVVLRKKFERRW